MTSTPTAPAAASKAIPATDPPTREPVLTWRTGIAYVMVISILAYWTSVSEGVVSATSFHSLSPPINIVVALFILSAGAVPFHRAIRARSRWAQGALFLLLPAGVRGVGSLGLLIAGNVAPAVRSTFPESITVSVALACGIALYWPVRVVLERVKPFTGRELIALYAMMMTGTLCTGYAVVQFLTPTLVAARYFKSAENHWSEIFFRYLPAWFGPTPPRLVKDFWQGGVDRTYWDLWVRPLALWLVFALAAMWVMFCLSALVQQQWIERERLTFPLVFLPLELAKQEEGSSIGPLFRSPVLWIGFAVPTVLHLFNGLNSYYPAVPTFTFRHINVMQSADFPPWNAVGGLDVTFYPLLVGFTYLLTLDLSLSVWVFFLLRKFEPVLGRAFGWHEVLSPGGKVFPFTDQQATGAFAAIVAMSLWTGRVAFLDAIRGAWTGRQAGPDAALSDRAIALGIVGGTGFLCVWSWAAGMGAIAAPAFFGIFFVWCLALSRIRAEAGLGGLTGPMTPQETMVMLSGSAAIGPQSLTVLAYYRWFTTDLRALASIMPAQLEDIRMVRAVGLWPRSLGAAVMFGSAFASLVAFIIYMPIIYRHGGVNMNGQRFTEVPVFPFRELASHLSSPKPADPLASGATFFGFLVTLGLSALRLRFVSWPLHPIGYAVGFSRRTIEWMWFSIFLGWLAKQLILRSGGLGAYRRFMPLFLGFILGEFSMGVIFAIVGTINPAAAGYQLYP